MYPDCVACKHHESAHSIVFGALLPNVHANTIKCPSLRKDREREPMKLEDIGFYTLSDDRVIQASATSPMWRCELILTDKCNFRCPYCRGLKSELQGVLSVDRVKSILNLWAKDGGLKNVRFSGGEPAFYPGLLEVIKHAKSIGVERIALSTNGSAPTDFYLKCIEAGVNDFSISLDACCSDFGKKMSGGIPGAWEKVVENIKVISKLTYVTLGMVFTEETVGDLAKTVEFGHSLGVADIRVISAAQYNRTLEGMKNIPDEILDAHPILKYRVNNARAGRNVRGIQSTDSHRCSLVMDDSVIAGKWHHPCIIYMREQGKPIGEVGPDMRAERIRWMQSHDTHTDPICQKNCLDVCIDYNNQFQKLRL